MSHSTASKQMTVNKANFAQVSWEELDSVPLEEGEVTFAIERFALTANNVTYAVLGNMIRYWQFFPAQTESQGIIPVWGVAKCTQSKSDQVKEGERFFGFWPMATELKMRPKKVANDALVDTAEHRKELPPNYNYYEALKSDNPDIENLMSVYQPLYATAYLLAHQIIANDCYHAEQVVFTSGSSKTALLCAQILTAELGSESKVSVVGATSTRNTQFVTETGFYDKVVSYDELSTLEANATTALIDFSGNKDTVVRVHQHHQDKVLFSTLVGITDWQSNARLPELPGATPEMFFAPAVYQAVAKQIGLDTLQANIARGLTNLVKTGLPIQMEVLSANESLQSRYLDFVAGNTDAKKATVLYW